MRIRAQFDPQLRILVEPDPVRVLVGEPLQWEFVSAYPAFQLQWTVYFEHSLPFGPGVNRLRAASLQQQVGVAASAHYVISPFAIAQDPGDHKYGIRVEDPISGKTLADDDPILIIIP